MLIIIITILVTLCQLKLNQQQWKYKILFKWNQIILIRTQTKNNEDIKLYF